MTNKLSQKLLNMANIVEVKIIIDINNFVFAKLNSF